VTNVHDLGLAEALRALRREAWVVLGVTAAVGAVAILFSLLQGKEYTASATVYSRDSASVVLLRGPKRNYRVEFVAPRQDPGREAVSSTRLASLDIISHRIAKRIGGGLSAEAISDMIDVRPVLESDVLEFQATARTPRLAAELANVFAHTYIGFRTEADFNKVKRGARLIERELRGIPARRLAGRGLRSRAYQLRTLEIITSLQSGNLEFVEKAKPPSSPSSPSPARSGLIGLGLGLLLGIAFGLIRDRIRGGSRSERMVPHRWVDRVASREYR
jgi:uncharacterized protein involved in exopolysaccharide biosynthesis